MCEHWAPVRVKETGEEIARVDPAWAPLLEPIFRANELEVDMPARLENGMARLRPRGGMLGRAWRALKWMFAVLLVAVVLDVAADRTERLPGQGVYSPEAVALMDRGR